MLDAEKANQISLEEFLEVEVCHDFSCSRTSRTDHCIARQRHKLGSNLTPVTPETFAKWKRTRMDKKAAEDEAMKKAKDAQAAAGKNSGMSGRDLVSQEWEFEMFLFTDISDKFTYNPEWFEEEEEEEDEWDIAQYRKQKEDEDFEAEEERIRQLHMYDEPPSTAVQDGDE